MATKKPAAPAAAEAPPAKTGSKKRLIIMILLVVLLIVISIGGTVAALKFLGPKDKSHDAAKTDEHGAAAEHAEPLAPAIYLELKPEIVVSFDVNGRQRFLKATVNILTRDKEVESALTLHSPVVANAMVMLISSKTFAELQTAEGKETLRQQSLEEINKILDKEVHKPNGVEQVLFSEFIMQ